ncbi:MAG: hypothetical protein QOK00_1469 [Thermoleophilaceae bacterium]|nr:hypothetical protein [Thermoleophilaceae bacterium]
MDTSKLSVGEQIAGVSGVVLLISLFLPWYGVDVSVGGFSASESASAWEAMGFIDILLFLVAVVAIGVPVARAMGSLPDDVPGPLLLVAAGAVGLLLVLYRLIDIPAPDIPDVAGNTIDFGRKLGIFVGLIAAGGVAYGGWRANAESPATPAPTAPPEPSTP